MTWQTTSIEKKTKVRLEKDLGESTGDEVYGYYAAARKKIIYEVAEEIRRFESGLTDHGPRHIEKVLNSAEKLLDDKIKELNGVSLYILLLSVLFHDVGNIYGREEHNNAISPIYDQVIEEDQHSDSQEQKKIILAICRAHCGETLDGSFDTLKEVKTFTHIFDSEISPRQIAAILRLADELSEGEQRTSEFLLVKNMYEKSNLIYHQYAKCTKVHIDPGNNRIGLRYHIKIKESKSDDRTKLTLDELEDFLPLMYDRIGKMNQERKYAKHYCQEYLSPYEKLTVSIDFWWQGKQLQVGDNEISLTDLVVPNDKEEKFIERYPFYKLDDLIPKLKSITIDSK